MPFHPRLADLEGNAWAVTPNREVAVAPVSSCTRQRAKSSRGQFGTSLEGHCIGRPMRIVNSVSAPLARVGYPDEQFAKFSRLRKKTSFRQVDGWISLTGSVPPVWDTWLCRALRFAGGPPWEDFQARLCRREQLGQPDQIFGCGGQREGPTDAVLPSMAGFAQVDPSPGPAKDLLDPLPDPQRSSVTGMPGGASIDGGAPIGVILGHMRVTSISRSAATKPAVS